MTSGYTGPLREGGARSDVVPIQDFDRTNRRRCRRNPGDPSYTITADRPPAIAVPTGDGSKKYMRMITDWRVNGGYRVYSPDGLARTLQATHNKTGFYAVPIRAASPSADGPLVRNDGDPAYSITTQRNGYVLDNHDIRRLMPIECERLQGFPDFWTERLTDNRRWKALGAAVMVPIIEHFGRLMFIEGKQ